MNFVELIKKNVVSLSAIATFTTTVVGGAFTLESRYAKAADIDGLKTYVQQSRTYDRWEQRQSTDLQRKQQVEDQLFILRLKQPPTATDLALIKRYEDGLAEVNARLNRAPPPAPLEK